MRVLKNKLICRYGPYGDGNFSSVYYAACAYDEYTCRVSSDYYVRRLCEVLGLKENL